jgi:hypothetical protein
MSAADHPWDFDATADNRSAQVIQIESLGKGGWAMLTAAMVLACIGLAMAWTARDRATLAERETRVLQDQLQTARLEWAKRGIVINTDDHQ